MRGSAAFLAAMGVSLLFFPHELGSAFGWAGAGPTALQLASGGTLGFALLNWVGRGAIYGGIFGRPIVVGNLWHGLVATLVLVGWQLDFGTTGGSLALTALLLLYTVAFGVLLVRAPWHERG